jgi:hypothetical protein
MDERKIVEDFLPSPDQAVLREDKVTVTVSLSKGVLNSSKRKLKSSAPHTRK